MPVPILDQAVVTIGANLYLFCGISNADPIQPAYRFNGSNWSALRANPGGGLESPSVVTDGTFAYQMNGSRNVGNYVDDVYRYDPATDTYLELASTAIATWNQTAVYLSGRIYKLGGNNSSGYQTAVEIYNVATNTWTMGAPLPVGTGFAVSWTQGNFIYIAGGLTGSGVGTNKTYRYDPATNAWDDAAIADLPATRWGAASTFYGDSVVIAGGYVGGDATVDISDSVIAWDAPANTWVTMASLPAARARMAGSVLNGSFHVIGGRSVSSPNFGGTPDNQRLTCQVSSLTGAGSSIVAAGPNAALDPGETVTIAFRVQNTGPAGNCTTAALTGTLLTTGGVTNPMPPAQNYGVICAGGPPVSREFTFTVDPNLTCGASVVASLVMTDGAANYGTFSSTFTTSTNVVVLAENFDAVAAPALPAGWVAANAVGPAPLWTNASTSPFSAPNAAFVDSPAMTSDKRLETPGMLIRTTAARVSFRNSYNMEAGFDGGVLEVSAPNINGGAFTDIRDPAIGGTFVSGGYTLAINFGSPTPLAGRSAWSGNSNGYIHTVADLGPNIAGQMVRLRFRMATENSGAGVGWRIDDVVLTDGVVCAPVPQAAASRKTHGGTPFDIPLPLAGGIGVEGRRAAAPSAENHQVIVSFAGAVSLSGVTVTSANGAATAIATANDNIVTVDLANVADAQRITLNLENVQTGSRLGDVAIAMGLLAGDANGNGQVTASDIGQVKGQSGQAVTGENFRTDVNASGGTINASDIGLVKSTAGNQLP